MVFGPKARRRPSDLRIVVRLAMEAILPLSGKKSGSVSPHCSHSLGLRGRDAARRGLRHRYVTRITNPHVAAATNQVDSASCRRSPTTGEPLMTMISAIASVLLQHVLSRRRRS